MSGHTLGQGLAEIRAAGLYRRRRILDGPQAPRIRLEGRDCLSFTSNDYLGLASDPRVAEAYKAGIDAFGSGSGASHLVSGHTRAHHELESRLAEWTGREAALVFSTGYMANLGVVAALAGRGDRVYEDRLNHASLLDAGLLSGARVSRYPHTDTEALAQRLARDAGGNRLVVTDGVFSMDGDTAPLPELARLAERHDAWLMVDDAHGLGVIGPDGRGSVAEAGLGAADVPILVGTLGKAFGTFGAFVAGSAELVDYLVQRARTYIYTTALPPGVATATLKSLEIAAAEPWRRTHLQALVRRFRAGAADLGFELMASETPIQPIRTGSSEAAMQLSEYLMDQGIWVTPIRPPTVPRGGARLRVTFSAAHSEADVDQLLQALRQAAGGASP